MALQEKPLPKLFALPVSLSMSVLLSMQLSDKASRTPMQGTLAADCSSAELAFGLTSGSNACHTKST